MLIQGDTAHKAANTRASSTQRVRDLLIHHPRGSAERYVTLSAGVASLVPPRELALAALGKACRAALQRAKAGGKNTVVTAESADFK